MTETRATVQPPWVAPGGRVHVTGVSLPSGTNRPPRVLVGERLARVQFASTHHLQIVVPSDLEGGTLPILVGSDERHVGDVLVARPLTEGLHQVDNPAFDGLGRLYLTHSGSRGAKVPVPLYRLRADGVRDPIAVELANPTSLALGPDGAMYVSSRFEGHVYRLTPEDTVELFASDLGVATGLAFDRDGALYVGDRSGTIFRVSPDRRVESFATLPASVAAFHLAFGPDGSLYVAAPTLASHDPVYRVTPDRLVDVACDGFGRPQGLAFDADGKLYVADALAGAAGLYRIDPTHAKPEPECVLSAPAIVGLAFDPDGGIVLASNDTAWRLDVPARPLALTHT